MNNAPYNISYHSGVSNDDDRSIDASDNWWGTVEASAIAESVYDFFDDFTSGKINYVPFLAEPSTTAPPSPPSGLAAASDANALTIDLGWDPNPEEDIAGYRVHYKTGDAGFPYDGTGASEGGSGIDVGNVTVATVSGLAPWVPYHVAVTAYDIDGDESWYSEDVEVTLEPGVDNAPPYATGHIPTPGATGVATDARIVVHVRDDGSGVDQGSIALTVEGVDVTGQATITGGTGDYTVTYDPPGLRLRTGGGCGGDRGRPGG